MSAARDAKHVWLPVPGWPGYELEVHSQQVRSIDRIVVNRNGVKHRYSGRMLKPSFAPRATRPNYKLSVAGVSKTMMLDALVAAAQAGA